MDTKLIIGLIAYSILLPFVLNIIIFGKESVVRYDLKKFWNKLKEKTGKE